MYVFWYIFLGLGMFILTLPPRKERNRMSASFIFRVSLAALLFAFFMGARYDIGKDWLAMCRIYLDRMEGIENYYLELHYAPFFYYLTTYLADNQIHYFYYFFAIALIQISMLFYSLKNYPRVISSVVLIFFLGCTWYAWSNIARQSVAHVFILAAICALSDKKILRCAFFMILAVFSHKSALIMVPFLFLYDRKFKPMSVSRQTLLSCFMFIFTLFKINIIMHALQLGAAIPFFSKYARLLSSKELVAPSELGLGFYISVLINFILIVFSDKIKKYYNSKFVNYLYMLFYIGVLLEYLFIANPLISRMNVYFIGNRFILCGFAIYCFWKFRKCQTVAQNSENAENTLLFSPFLAKVLLGTVASFSLLTFVGVVIKGKEIKVDYKFYWNEDDGYELEDAKRELAQNE